MSGHYRVQAGRPAISFLFTAAPIENPFTGSLIVSVIVYMWKSLPDRDGDRGIYSADRHVFRRRNASSENKLLPADLPTGRRGGGGGGGGAGTMERCREDGGGRWGGGRGRLVGGSPGQAGR